MMGGLKLQQGLTTVELVVTLFVAAMMVISGSQLYNAVTNRSANSRMMAEASNIGYETLRKLGSASTTTTLCTASSHPTQAVEPADIGISETRLPNLGIEISRCLPLTGVATSVRDKVMRVTVKVTYATPAREVVHATYVTL